MIVGSRAQPRRRPLEDEQLADFRRDLGDELRRARAGADHRDALPREIDARVPSRRVKRRAREAIAPRDVGKLRTVELADGAHDGVGFEGLLGAAGDAHTHLPPVVIVVPRRREDLGLEADVLAQSERISTRTEVTVQHVLRREMERPVVTLCERVAVVVIRVVDAASRILVLPPGAADITILLEDHERDAGLLQAMGREQPRHPRADDHDVEVGPGFGHVPCRRSAILTPIGQLLLEEGQVGGHVGSAHRVLHDPQQHLVVGHGRGL